LGRSEYTTGVSNRLMNTEKKIDILSMGRSSIDLYSNNIGSSFIDIKEFSAFVGGCPTNISVGTRRLGINSALLTGIGDDPVGDFILNFLKKENVNTDYISRKIGKRSSAVILGIEPPDKFPLVYYREDCADINIDISDVKNVPLDQCKSLLISGTGLSKEPSRSATIFAAEQASMMGIKVFLDIDFRADQWPDLQSFGAVVRSVLSYVDIVIGTSEEVKAAAYTGGGEAIIEHSQVNESKVDADLGESVKSLLSKGPEILLLKSGTEGCYIHHSDTKEPVHAPGYPVEVINTLGAGDAFASGFIYGVIEGWSLYKSARLGNACGAILVTQHGCANFMPTMDEVIDFTKDKGGLD
jgi:5-dehydro-2-deoxygluconokinase